MKSSHFSLICGAVLILTLAGCSTTNTPLTHVWKEIKGIGVPYQGTRSGEAVLLADLKSNGCVWLPAGTTVFGDRPWPRSPYAPIFAYRLPQTSTKWPCTAEAVDGGLIYFSHAVIPSKRILCLGGVSESPQGSGKSVVKKKR
jgi:hypothetical protein